MSTPLAQSRCFSHGDRAAVARCPSCEQFYCRECVTEHSGRMICSGCLESLYGPKKATRTQWRAHCAAGLLTVAALGAITLVFYLFGLILLRIPASFHDGTVFQ